jgi:hypothetical protein
MAKKTIEERIQSLENWRRVLVTVGIIFGLTGGWGLFVLRSVQSQLTTAKTQLSELECARENAELGLPPDPTACRPKPTNDPNQRGSPK